MADSLLHAELLAACSAIGYSDGDKYYLEADHLETIKDLIRYMRKDDDSHRIRRALGETRVLQTDLIPIVKFHNDNNELFDVALRLLVNLTTPVLILFKEELPEEKITYQQYLQILNHQQGFKQSFANDSVWKVLVGILGKILEKEWDDREEEERLTLERILVLIRNILAVPSNPEEEKRTDDDASVHDQVLWALHLARLEDLLLYIASSETEQDLCFHVLEIISLMLREQDPAHLASAGLQRSQSEKKEDELELLKIRERENLIKQQQIRKHSNARHSRFGGTYYVANMKSISDRQLITHKHVSDFASIEFDMNKKPRKTRKNRIPLKDCHTIRRSTLAIRLFLQEFCVEFLNGAYNSIMYTVKDDLNRGKSQKNDESYYLWAIKFFLSFNRNHKFKVELITESLNVQQFHYIQTQFENYFEQMSTDKKKIPLWSRRMHKALEAYQELLLTIHFMDKSTDKSVTESSHILKNKVFYQDEYRELALLALQNFNETKMTRTYLKDLVETVHIFLKLLENTCGQQKHIYVQSKSKTRNKRKKKQTKPSVIEGDKEEQWIRMTPDFLELIRGNNEDLPITNPYDALSDETEEIQKEKAMKKIHFLLHKSDCSTALSLFRSSRDFWPENNPFGTVDIEPEEELECLKLIYDADLNTKELQVEENESSDSEQSDAGAVYKFSESEFNILEFVRRFAHTKIMQAYGILFKTFLSNSEYTNHCILKLYHRIAWDCKLPGIFFQASMFRIFQKILDAPVAYSQAVKDGVKFSKYILRKFFDTAASNDKIFIEILFWKTNKEALEIEVGYGNCEPSKPARNCWTEEEEFEIRQLFEEFKDKNELPADKDIADMITENLINKQHTRRMVVKKLKAMDLITNIRELKRKTISIRDKQWPEEEVEELKLLYEEHKNSIHPIARIMDFKLSKRSKHRVINKLIELELIQDKKEVGKKRIPKVGGRNKNTGEQFLDTNNNSSEESSSNDESEDNEDETVVRRSFPVREIPTISGTAIQAGLKAVVEDGLESAVEWIAELLEDTANDREEDDDFQPIPILALGDEHNRALENEHFQELMHLVGLHAPIQQQEIFWRIPSSLSVHGLRNRVEFLRKGNLNVPSDNDKEKSHPRVSNNGGRESADSDSDVCLSDSNRLTSDVLTTSVLTKNNIRENNYSVGMSNLNTRRFNSSDSDDGSLMISGRNVLTNRNDSNNIHDSDSEDETSRRFSRNPTPRCVTTLSSDSEDYITMASNNLSKRKDNKPDSDEDNSDSQNLYLIDNMDADKLGKEMSKRKTISSDDDSPEKIRKVPRLRVVSDSD